MDQMSGETKKKGKKSRNRFAQRESPSTEQNIRGFAAVADPGASVLLLDL